MAKGRTRGLSDAFLEAFMDGGILHPILERVRQDHTLDFQIRREQVHIYYRGGRLLNVQPRNGRCGYTCDVDYNYGPEISAQDLPREVEDADHVQLWVGALPILKSAVDRHYTEKVEKCEREFSQLIVRENNYSRIANDTDYFIADMEYTGDGRRGQFDLIALHWPSDSQARKKGQAGLAFIEVKYGDGALDNASGLEKHIEDANNLVDEGRLTPLREEMLEVFRQKRKLGLVRFSEKGNPHDLCSWSSDGVELIIILINHDPAKSKLFSVLESLPPLRPPFELKFGLSSFMGFGLFNESVLTLDELRERCPRSICGKPPYATTGN